MNNKTNPKSSVLLHFMLRAQQVAQKDALSAGKRSEEGYAMLLTAVITILIFSMLGAFLTMTNLSKSSTSAYIDGSNTFYASESGLNRRASQIREKFVGYQTPTGPVTTTPITAASVSKCYTVSTGATVDPTNDFECRNYAFRYNNNAATSKDKDGNTVVSDNDQNANSVNYTAFTLVADKTDCTTGTGVGTVACIPKPKTVPAGQDYAGLSVIENRYVVYSSAGKPDLTTPSTPFANTNAKTVLQMEFKNRAIPLFQFAVFYDGDLEMTSTSPMDISGKVHTNADLYLQPSTNVNNTTFADTVTSAGGIYRRVDAMISGATTGGVKIKIGALTLDFPAYDSALKTPIDLSAPTIGSLSTTDTKQFQSRVRDKTAGVTKLSTPPPGFLRKRSYFKSSSATTTLEQQAAVGQYWAKADMRLEMVPDRDAVTTAGGTTHLNDTQINAAIASGNAWNRNEAIIPFNFTSIQTGGTGACTTTPPVANADPAVNYIDPQRNNASTLKCNSFTKGQLQSLRQPVLVMTDINNPALITEERAVLRAPTAPALGEYPAVAAFPVITGLTNFGKTTGKETQILRAIQVALASTSRPVPLDSLDKALNDATYAAGTPQKDFKDEFKRLLGKISGLSSSDLDTWKPSEIAALKNGWFLPAPIQRITSAFDNAADGGRTNTNIRSSGFYDGREKRWITMLQTNIKSLTVWNRDGLYVEADNQIATLPSDPAYTADYNAMMATPYNATTAAKDASFNSGTGANFTDMKAFVRAAADATKPGFKKVGLGSTNATEGGLVFHSTVSDDLNGDGTKTDVTTEVQKEDDGVTEKYLKNTDGTDMYEKNADGSFKYSGGVKVRSRPDYVKKYWGSAGYQSPFAFAINGGDFLPAAMNMVTDQSVYIQGDFNNNGAIQKKLPADVAPPNTDRVPAAIMADTITNLSNQCLATSSAKSATNHLGVLAGQLPCGLPRTATGSKNVTEGGVTPTYYLVTSPTAVNAAYLSNTDRSIGNCKTIAGTPTCGGTTKSSGGINNYMRMLEDWQQTQYFNYSGSFVSLGTPLEYSGRYIGGGTYYMIPARNFNFDPYFSAFSGLPPMTPSVVYLQQEVFKRNF